MLFEAKPKIACPECDIPVIYGDTPKSNVLDNKDMEDVAQSQEQQNAVVPQPQLEQANQALVAQSGAQEYAPHVINTPLSFLIKSALNTNIFGEPGWQGTGWRAGRDLQRHDIGGKTGTTNSSKDAWFSGYGPGVVTSVWIGFDDHRRDLGRTTASGAIKDQISGYEGGAKSAQPAWDAYMKAVLEGVPEQPLTPPPGIVTVNIDRSTGQLANGGNSRAEYFIEGTQPTTQAVHEVGTELIDNGETHELF
ncbi:Penicillin-binding protein 1A [compost metagenome]